PPGGRASGSAPAQVMPEVSAGRHGVGVPPMLAAFLIAGLVTAPLSSVPLFAPYRRSHRTTGRWPAVRRLVSALVGTAVLAAVVFAVLTWLGASTRNTVAGTAAVVVARVLW